ncbi:MAG: DUF3592 domain-containing protein [Planctomycetes bacterium]|nr:DUF3592 domain-containing protein [Planctomycetota bacterium]
MHSHLRSRRRLGPVGTLVVCSIAFLVGLLVLVFGTLLPLIKQGESEHWIARPCTILEASTERHTSGKGHGTYGAHVSYRYELAGVEHTGTRLSFAEVHTSDPDDAREVAARYPVGTTVTCFVNPEDPTEAVLDRSASGVWLPTLVGVVFLVLGPLIFVLRKLRGFA